MTTNKELLEQNIQRIGSNLRTDDRTRKVCRMLEQRKTEKNGLPRVGKQRLWSPGSRAIPKEQQRHMVRKMLRKVNLKEGRRGRIRWRFGNQGADCYNSPGKSN